MDIRKLQLGQGDLSSIIILRDFTLHSAASSLWVTSAEEYEYLLMYSMTPFAYWRNQSTLIFTEHPV